MTTPRKSLTGMSHFIHEHFLWFLLGSYALAALCPGLGLWIRGISFGTVSLLHESTHVSLPMLMLAGLLFNAGLGVQAAELRNLRRSPRLLGAGLTANLLVPIAFIFAVSQFIRLWHNPAEVQHILIGLALIAAMPIAGSSTAWAQNANGNVALSLGLVLASTFLSPLTTPITFDLVEQVASGKYVQVLDDLESNGTGTMLIVCVLIPSLLGIIAQGSIGTSRLTSVKPSLKLANSVNLLLLNYSNASVSLPQTVADPDGDFLAVILVLVVGLCVLSFAVGWWLARILKADAGQRTSLMFGLGACPNNSPGAIV